jgi:hypothetical protein
MIKEKVLGYVMGFLKKNVILYPCILSAIT